MTDKKESVPDLGALELAVDLESKINSLRLIVRTAGQSASICMKDERRYVLIPLETFQDISDLLGLKVKVTDQKKDPSNG